MLKKSTFNIFSFFVLCFLALNTLCSSKVLKEKSEFLGDINIGDDSKVCTYNYEPNYRVNYCLVRGCLYQKTLQEAQEACSQIEDCGGISIRLRSNQYLLNPKSHMNYRLQEKGVFEIYRKIICQPKFTWSISPKKNNEKKKNFHSLIINQIVFCL